MAQSFSLPFSFQNSSYSAMVFMSLKGPENAFFQVLLLDESLHAIIPGGRFTFSSKEGFQARKDIKHELADELVVSISVAISKHLLLNNGIISGSPKKDYNGS